MEIYNELINQFSGDLSVGGIILTILTSLICAIIICIIYKKTYTGVNYNKSFSLAIILMALVTAVAIRTVNTNITLSLGMLGSLSIIRFRTAVKDIVDTIYMFWAILVGIMTGANLYVAAIVVTILIGIVYICTYLFNFQRKEKYIVIIKVNKVLANDIKSLENSKDIELKNEIYNQSIVELTYSVKNESDLNKFKTFQDNKDFLGLNIMSTK